MRKLAIYILVIPVLFVMMVSCGNSGSDRKQGEIYGECFKDNTCNEGLTCETEYNVCVNDDAVSDSDDAESIDVEADTESGDDADEISEQDYSEEIYHDTLPDDAQCWEYRCKDGDSYCGYKKSAYYEKLKWGKSEDCPFSECIASTGKCGCESSEEGDIRCSGNVLRTCSNGKWQIRERCKAGCDSAIDQCKPWEDPDSGLFWSMESNAMIWQASVDYCDNLTEGGFTDWRSPTINEARTMIKNCAGTQTGGRCAITDSCLSPDCRDISCNLCRTDRNNGYNKINEYPDSQLFWSASEVQGSDILAWGIELYSAGIAEKFKNEYGVTRCVRGENHLQLCEGLPEHAIWNKVSSIFSTWNGSSWQPPLKGKYNETSSTAECRFKCNVGYKWDGYKCKPSNDLPECGAESKTPCKDSSSGLIWSSMPDKSKNWRDAVSYCINHSESGGRMWSLPTIDELRTLVKNCPNVEYGGECAVSEEKGLLAIYESGTRESCFCYDAETEYNKFGDRGFFWSSSILSDYPECIWGIFMGYISYGAHGRTGVEILINSNSDESSGKVRCVVR
ncbi:DUF1566 domain-containing protein [bacterium]|nr:DUF1566 domain-containing protein [bacterium]